MTCTTGEYLGSESPKAPAPNEAAAHMPKCRQVRWPSCRRFASRYRKTSPKGFLFEVMPTSAVDPAQPDESIEHEQVHPFHGSSATRACVSFTVGCTFSQPRLARITVEGLGKLGGPLRSRGREPGSMGQSVLAGNLYILSNRTVSSTRRHGFWPMPCSFQL